MFNGATRVASITGSLSTNIRVHRLRLYPGWNLVSLAVTATNVLAQFNSFSGGEGQGEVVVAAYQWNPSTGDYSPVTAGQTVSAGVVLWIKAQTNAVVGITGSYREPTSRLAEAGGTYLAGAGLEAWSPNLPSTLSAWMYEPLFAGWHDQFTGDLASISDLPPTLSPGEALFVKTAAPADLEIPDPTLRIRYYHQDNLGSSSVITDADGNRVEEIAFYPFGHTRNDYEPRHLEEPYGFTQKERDKESGLHYFGARFYAPGIDRWLSCDPAGKAGGANPYAYTKNNPTRFVDPNGLQDADPDKLNDAIEKTESLGIDCGYNFNWSAWKEDPEAGLAACKTIASMREVEHGTTVQDDLGTASGGFGDALAPNIMGGGMDNQTLRENLGITTVHPGRGLYVAGGVVGIVFVAALGAGAPPEALPVVEPVGPAPLTAADAAAFARTENAISAATGASNAGAMARVARVARAHPSVIGVAETCGAETSVAEEALETALANKMAARIEMIAARRAQMDGLINAGRSAGPVILDIENTLDATFGLLNR